MVATKCYVLSPPKDHKRALLAINLTNLIVEPMCILLFRLSIGSQSHCRPTGTLIWGWVVKYGVRSVGILRTPFVTLFWESPSRGSPYFSNTTATTTTTSVKKTLHLPVIFGIARHLRYCSSCQTKFKSMGTVECWFDVVHSHHLICCLRLLWVWVFIETSSRWIPIAVVPQCIWLGGSRFGRELISVWLALTACWLCVVTSMSPQFGLRCWGVLEIEGYFLVKTLNVVGVELFNLFRVLATSGNNLLD
jgi:hypothetical protein